MGGRVSAPDIRGIYAIFSKAFFVPAMLEDMEIVREPFRSAIESVHSALHRVIETQSLKPLIDLWEKDYFIPHIGKLEFNTKINIPNRLLLNNRWKDPDDDDHGWRYLNLHNCTYLRSEIFNKVLHNPILVPYKKKIQFAPKIGQFIKNIHRSSPSLDISQNNRFYIHIYPYGVFYLHLTLSLQSKSAIPYDGIIQYLHAIKTGQLSYASDALAVNVADDFSGALDAFYSAIWNKISHAFFAEEQQSIGSSIHDSIRIMPIGHIKDADFRPYEITKAQIYRTIQGLDQLPDDTWETVKAGLNKNYGTDLPVHNLWKNVALKQKKFWADELDTNLYEYVKNIHYQLLDPKYFFSLNRFCELLEDSRQLRRILSTRYKIDAGYYQKLRSIRSEFPDVGYWDWAVDYDDQIYLYGEPDNETRMRAEQFKTEHPEVIEQYIRIRESLYGNDTAWASQLSKILHDYLLQFIREQKQIILTANEIYGIMVKDKEYQKKEIDKSAYHSVWGLEKGDLFLPKSNSTLMMTNAWSQRKQLPLFLQWKLTAAYELATSQKMVAEYYTRQLQDLVSQRAAGKLMQPDAGLSDKQIGFLFGLVNLHEHFPADFRKWYYQQAEAIGAFKAQDRLRKLLDQYIEHAHPSGVIDLRDTIIHQLQIGLENVIVSNGDYVQGTKVEASGAHSIAIGGNVSDHSTVNTGTYGLDRINTLNAELKRAKEQYPDDDALQEGIRWYFTQKSPDYFWFENELEFSSKVASRVWKRMKKLGVIKNE